jgi:hypothetical protein
MSLTISSHTIVGFLNVVAAEISIVSNNGHYGSKRQLTLRFESSKLRVGLESVCSMLNIMHEA